MTDIGNGNFDRRQSLDPAPAPHEDFPQAAARHRAVRPADVAVAPDKADNASRAIGVVVEVFAERPSLFYGLIAVFLSVGTGWVAGRLFALI